MYSALLDEPQGEDALRLLEVKRMALDTPSVERSLLFQILVGRDGIPADAATTVYLADRLSELRTDGLGTYLAARQLFYAQRFDLAAEQMRRAQVQGLPTRLLGLAALRVQAVSLFARGQLDESSRAWTQLGRQGDLAHQLEVLDWQRRIEWAKARSTSL